VAQAEASGVALDAVSDAMIEDALAEGAGGLDGELVARLADERTLPDALRTAAGLEGALASCDVVGGTAPDRVADALRGARERLDRERAGRSRSLKARGAGPTARPGR